ncbi:tRNA adenosine(34) deaminase TadA [Pseudoteredinibacter isoporae]|uniref:tRNA-specific adenosine deaminase n=1 Tax=Pseudoteredinibacter isoporae TaxID=570281 RepID=A0A7X0JVZ1_9GAMM|nr:tRNA adenosine(34) deaminase TadA [Pseudoteredinibacter isoporae]MBB6523265.1 tRNA(adenine34) deaminase [Pseudoteredinibacter isoporae]NHO88781.1 tRNA adenosine(34) deaminase TadA [Pseudoteredinibacter isoporae]NIB22528.1 tRNA adenosine(34) deaminase TadA [Pseudoteredinibacter isoporae]
MNEVLDSEALAELSQLEQDEYWMRRCMSLATKAAEAGEVPVGAIIVHEHQLIAEAFNQPISTNDPSAHAEILVLRSAGQVLKNYRLSNCTLYVTLEPCSMCAGALVHSRISRLVYGATEPKAGAIESQVEFLNSEFLNHRLEWQGGVLAEETSAQLSDFFKRRRAQKKADKNKHQEE